MKKPALAIAFIAALQGGLGVALSAASAHLESSPNLTTASQFFLFHAGAGLGLAAVANSVFCYSRWLTVASFALQGGVTLFALDLSLRAFGFGKLFAYAAPIGGSLTILSWLALAAWALTEMIFPRMQADRSAPRN